jgi:hypothetical protein
MDRTMTNAQGWYYDPYRQHSARWFSDGTPTKLVRDDGVVSHDPPPNIPYTDKLEPIAETEGGLLHADGGEGRCDRDSGVNAVWDVFVARGGD